MTTNSIILTEVKVKLSMCLINHHAEKAYGGVAVQRLLFLTRRWLDTDKIEAFHSTRDNQ
jgi:hypothetical protein